MSDNNRTKDEDAFARAWAKHAAATYSTGNFTASQTGAKQLAAQRYAISQQREILNAAGAGTSAFENRAIKRNPRPTRTRGY